ncbi:FkbM family methyltransferase [Microcoleus sp. A006_D1]|uniref:FkbM family methyltransferase n=1 Tax=Microcoleus sp. A006_D1 TaxID=3055267 RepID=UPI002FD01A4B
MLFLPSLKKTGHLDRVHITVGIVGSRKIGDLDDYASQGWEIFAPNLTIYGFDADAEACNEANADLEARQVNWTEKHIPLALSNTEGKATLYVTKYPGCSSLYPPSEEYIKRFSGNSELIELKSTVDLSTTTLENFCKTEDIKEIDFLHLDVQGAELKVLQGADGILNNSVLGLVTEVEFTELYAGQPLFSDVDIYLRNRGLTLFDFGHMQRDMRREIPVISNSHPGALIWSDAFYFRDLMRSNVDPSLKTPEKLLKLACLADVMKFHDYALEILVYLTLQYGGDIRYNLANNIIESLAQIPELVKLGLSSLPIIAKIRDYSSGYSAICVLSDQTNWQQRGNSCLFLGDYSKAASIYEQAIESEPNIKSHYWHLGLMLLLQEQESEALTVWFTGILEENAEQIEECTSELIEVIQTEAQRREGLTDYAVARILRQHIREIAPTDINNLLKIVELSINMNTFINQDLISLGIVELLRSELYPVNSDLLLQVLQSILNCVPYEQSTLEFATACQRYASDPQAFVKVLMLASPNIADSKNVDAPTHKYSYLDEETIIDKYLNQLSIENKYCVDIAASDGITMSNTYFLYKQGWAGLAIEYDSQLFTRLALRYSEFEKVNLSKCMVTPENVVDLMKTHQVPDNFSFLNLDIDGYDYFVLDQILSSFRPLLVCVEINEKIPPPLKFTVNYSPNYVWNNDHFFGQSISQLNIICQQYNYTLVELHYNNAFLIPQEISPAPSLTPEEAYRRGYLEQPDRKNKFPWNADIEQVHNLSPQEALIYITNFFSKYEGEFTCYI